MNSSSGAESAAREAARPDGPSEMEERVARALYGLLAADPDWDDAPLTEAQRVSDDDDPSQECCRQLARAAIEAMREPTSEQRVAGATAVLRGMQRGCALTAAQESYSAMIDAALTDDGHPRFLPPTPEVVEWAKEAFRVAHDAALNPTSGEKG